MKVCTLLLLIFRAFKKILEKEFEHFKSCDVAVISHFILETELWESRYEELLRIFKSYINNIFIIWEL